LECSSDCCPSGKFSHLHRGDLALLSRLLNLAGWPALGRALVIPNFHLRMEATVLGHLQCCRNVLVPFPTILSRSSTDNSLACYCSDMHGQLWDLIDRCVPFSNHVQSIEFTTGELKVVETYEGSSMETGSTWA
jgi:hypothetical protein